jgi:hypothetical protein
VFLIYSQSYANSTHYLIPEYFSTSKKKLYWLAVILHSLPPVPMASTNPLLSPWTCLFWAFHINRIIQKVAFCAWNPSFSIRFSRFLHSVADISSLLIYIYEMNIYIYVSHFLSALTIWWKFGLFPLLAIISNTVVNTDVQIFAQLFWVSLSFMVTPYFTFWRSFCFPKRLNYCIFLPTMCEGSIPTPPHQHLLLLFSLIYSS